MGQRGHGKSRVYHFVYRKGNKNRQLGTRFFIHHGIVSAVKIEEFVSDRVSYIHSLAISSVTRIL